MSEPQYSTAIGGVASGHAPITENAGPIAAVGAAIAVGLALLARRGLPPVSGVIEAAEGGSSFATAVASKVAGRAIDKVTEKFFTVRGITHELAKKFGGLGALDLITAGGHEPGQSAGKPYAPIPGQPGIEVHALGSIGADPS